MLFERLGSQAYEVTDIAVSAGIIIDRLTDSIFGSVRKFFELAVDVLLDLILQIIVHLLAFEVHQLNTVIVIRVMAGRDHGTAVKLFSSCDVADARCGRYVQ